LPVRIAAFGIDGFSEWESIPGLTPSSVRIRAPFEQASNFVEIIAANGLIEGENME